MEGFYEVKFDLENVGKVQVIRQGLYYRFVCNCILKEEKVYRLMINCGNSCEKIGILIPDGPNFSLDKKLPIKRFGKEIPQFYIVSQHIASVGKFVPVYPEEPFAYIEKLKNAFLAIQNGKTGVFLKADPEAVYDRF